MRRSRKRESAPARWQRRVTVQKKLEHPPRTNLENTSLNALKLFPGISFSMMFRFLWVSRIYRRRMALFCGKKYDLELNLVLILLAASEGHVQQGILASSLGINKNAMVFLIDNLEITTAYQARREPR